MMANFCRQIIRTGLTLAALVVAATSAVGKIHVQSRPVYSYSADSDSLCIVAFPLAVNRDDLKFLEDSITGTYASGLFVELTILDSAGKKISSQSNSRLVTASSAAEANATGYKVFDRLMAALRPGSYGATLTVIDLATKNEEQLDYGALHLRPWDGQLAIGGVCFAYHIRSVGDSVDDQTARLVDNGLLVIPNPLGVFNLSDSALWLYAEVYGLQYDSTQSGRYKLAFSIVDAMGTQVRDFGYNYRSKAGTSALIAEQFSLDGLPRGGFQLRMIVSDQESLEADTATLTFWHIASTADLYTPRTAFDSLSIAEQVSAMRYLMNVNELSILTVLPEEGQRNFIRQYWQEHDAQKSSTQFVSQDEIVKRFRYANEHFSTNEQRTNGWKSDFGRIYMKYGPWEERTDQVLPIQQMPYQIWHYRSQKGYYFIFVDTRNTYDFRMVHSNAPGERYDPSWEAYFKDQLYQYK
jgi:GWxTD domain-containing protein